MAERIPRMLAVEAQTARILESSIAEVRNGSVRVPIGNTQKMGTGTNVQRHLVALHQLDATWKPTERE